ncbi:foldase protein PrsA [Peptoclostridium acidaminophilum DSM 3953]|uniref:Foldase protein PrsA n=1 Tax=Peptoclostridium acidaminophilum DSM 3953 TaxID=1286171 RepID=W8TMC4_PEPAC|nr:peptidylprolyl isomerase [Peptoclostridium acidaminophilum]AHM57357.1 foldase protein PrsA [Peptoclostridium acidaminophilum DSM 3953]
MEENRVLAKVGDREITEKDVDFLLQSLGPQKGMQFYSPEGRKQLLDEIINQELFYLDALESELDKEEAFIAEMEQVKVNLLKQYAMRNLLQAISVDPAEAKEFYENNKASFVSQESARASHILVETEEEAKKVADEIAEGLDFAEAAQKYSKCPSGSGGGDLGMFTRGKMVPEFEDVAFAMEVGAVSEPFQTQFGYHIIKLGEKHEQEEKSYEEAKADVARIVLGKKQNEAYNEKTSQMRSKYSVEILG